MSGETEAAVSGWTTDTLHSQIQLLLEERDKRFHAALDSLSTTFSTRLNAIDRATDKFENNLARVPTDVDKQVGHVKELVTETFKTHEEQFRGIQVQFVERDVRVLQSAAAATTAVNAALQAAKEAVGEQNKSFTLSIDKSEKSTLEQINQQRLLLQTNYAALNDKIIQLDTRMTRFEGLGLGTQAAQATQQVVHAASQVDRGFTTSVMFAAISALVAIASIAIAILKP